MSSRKTVAVLGGGSAGFTAAKAAAAAGARVLLFMGDNADMASLCVNRGCMPSKAMFEPIDAMHHARRQGWLRVEPYRPEAYLAQIVAWKDREIARFRAFRQSGIGARASEDFQIHRVDAHFVDANTLSAGGERFHFDAAIVATGSQPTTPPIPGLDALRGDVWTNDDVLSNTALPDSLTLIGAGAIGLEFALRYARLGCTVTVIARSRPMSRYPESFGARIAQIYESEGIRMMLGTRTTAVRRDVEGLFVVDTEGPDGSEPVASQRVLLAVGRRPALEGLGLEKLGIELTAGAATVSEDMRIAGTEHVFAAGDAVGRRMVVHQAHIEAGIAAENAVRETSRTWEQRSNVMVVFTDPEFAYVGQTPDEARAAGRSLTYGRKESSRVGKLHLGGDDHGFGEFFADAESHALLGAGLLCHDASNLIHLPGYMIDHGHTVHTGARAEYYHPTRIEIVSAIIDDLCSGLGGTPPRRADE